MTLHPVDGPVPDPFFAAVRRRHPDVDLVLLPPEAPDPAADPGAVGLVRADLETVRGRAAELGAVLGAEAEERMELGTVGGTVRASARSLTRTHESGVVDDLVGAAEEQGWTLRRHDGPVELVQGTQGELRLRASYATTTGVLIVEVSGPDRPVGREQARELTGAA